MNERISLLLKEENLTAGKFAEILGVQPSGISHLISGRNKPNFDFIARVLTCFPAISPDWLILGEGEMYRQVAPVQDFIELPGRNSPEMGKGGTKTSSDSHPIPSLPEKKLSLPSDDEKMTDKTLKALEKQVVKIVFFYTDRTFSVYTESEFI